MIVLRGILGLAALTLAWALRSAIKDLELAQYEAQEWEQKAHAAARVADRLARELADEIDAHCGAGPQIEGGLVFCTAGMIIH